MYHGANENRCESDTSLEISILKISHKKIMSLYVEA